MFGRLLRAGVREDRLIAHLMGACLIMFVAQLPTQARIAHLSQDRETPLALDQLIGTTFFAWLMIMPLVFYLLALLLQGLLWLFGIRPGGYPVRLALFWGLLAASPVALLWGLLSGLNGQGPGSYLVFAIWVLALAIFFVQGLREAGSGAGTGADTKPEAGHAA
ncbi:MAG: hypothetical protein JJT81_04645 [Rubellimicrobium sp.]|nr:hypothetical protein [Rubellimicrobium sp.]